MRLADRLAPQWEGVDLGVTGVVAGLPQPFEGGVRFDFDVEQVETAAARLPQRIALAWYNGSSREEFQDIAPIRAGERWRFSVHRGRSESKRLASIQRKSRPEARTRRRKSSQKSSMKHFSGKSRYHGPKLVYAQ